MSTDYLTPHEGSLRQVITLTPTQAEEVSGLLDVCEDERESWGPPWGELDRHTLIVIRPTEARDDIQRRADYLRDEGNANDEQQRGLALARSLRSLADQINDPTGDARHAP